MNLLAKNLLILASAGSGKTFRLGNRVIGLVAAGVAPERIVALTFTRKAAGEFADSVLTKLARAAEDPETADALRAELRMPQACFAESLERVVRALPSFTLGTMDGFFSRMVRGFQYELGLTGGRFDLLEGPRADAAKDELLAEILSEPLEDGRADEFLHVFRRATAGKEGVGVLESLREFVGEWHGRFRAGAPREWGPELPATAAVEDWEANKRELAAKALRGLDAIDYTRKGQREALEKAIGTLAAHTIGSGSLGGATSLLAGLLQAAERDGPLELKFYKEFVVGGVAGDALKNLVRLAAACEMAAAVARTRALRDAVAVFDERSETRLRRRGLLGFDDVKVLMGAWATGEEARLRREAVDFRLGARYEHWLLDEFQDTSAADWTGLLPLIDEAATGDETTVFIVGDRKQAIYGWRGGDVGLFDEVTRRYAGGLEVETMAESWRSCPEVLELVNRVCGDRETLAALFGPAAGRWEWTDHFSAPPLARPDKAGEARVEIAGDWEQRKIRLAEILRELETGRRAMTCGVLVRNNRKVREVADELRAAGFDVIEEGRREPSRDNPAGIAIGYLLHWLADPADTCSREVLAMSPLMESLAARYGPSWQSVWEKLSTLASERGFAGMVGAVVEPEWGGWSAFGRRRAGDVIGALAELDARGGATPREAADWIARLEISQSPGLAAVQVMTVHKSKGLGFDVVILPEIPEEKVPLPQYFTAAEGEGWICQPPAKWARQLIPEMREAEARWCADQQYEALCLLYVALTRAKRGLYVLLPEPAESSDESKASLANWMAASLDTAGGTGAVFQSGSPGWVASIPLLQPKPPERKTRPLGTGVARRDRITPSGPATPAFIPPAAGDGIRLGGDVHAILETIGWIDETPAPSVGGEAGLHITRLLAGETTGALFRKAGRRIDLLREQPVEAIANGGWLSGVIDRLHVHRDASGAATLVEVIDFKTEPAESVEDLAARHLHQMRAYRTVIERSFPGTLVECLIVSTRLAEAVRIESR